MFENIFSKPELLWFILGLILFLLELVIPGFFIFFFGLGAWAAALACLIWEPGVNLQIIIFALVSVATLIALRKMIQKKFFYVKDEDAQKVEDEFTGREAVVTEDIGPGTTGKVEFKGTNWKAESKAELKAGSRVIITGKEDFKLFVEPKNN
jgi:membrane protein implicated in regulation of membrane protease activity